MSGQILGRCVGRRIGPKSNDKKAEVVLSRARGDEAPSTGNPFLGAQADRAVFGMHLKGLQASNWFMNQAKCKIRIRLCINLKREGLE